MSLKRSLFIVFISMGLLGCSQLSYYGQAAKGQWQIISKRQPISKIIKDSRTPEDLRQRLQLVMDIREFASTELGLPDNDSFRFYSDLGRSHVVWNVIATPGFDINPKTWCFPVAGCIAYKGFFSEANAVELENSLVQQGYDTFSYGVSAYSTLGWFTDPVLNTFINYSDLSLAGLIFHELAHQVVYIKDDSSFNEAFATTVEYAGVERWIEQNQSADKVIAYKILRDKQSAINDMVLQFRNELAQLYKDEAKSPDLKKLKQQQFRRLKAQYDEIRQQNKNTPYYDWWFGLDLNNAHLSALATYHDLVPAFLRRLRQSDSLPSFYQSVIETSRLDRTARDNWLKIID